MALPATTTVVRVVHRRRVHKNAVTIQAWARGVSKRWDMAMAGILVMCVRRWYRHRRRMKRRLFKVIARHYAAQEYRRGLAKKYILRWLYCKRARAAALRLMCEAGGRGRSLLIFPFCAGTHQRLQPGAIV